MFVDAHVHIHDCLNIQKFISAAADNFALQAAKIADGAGSRYVLCLTETCEADKFAELAWLADAGTDNAETAGKAWSFRRTDGDESLVASHPDFAEITIVAGRQIVTAERLEILALGTTRTWEDGQAVSDVVESVLESGALPVLPWGFGKWMGRRQAIVQSVIKQFGHGSFFLGDNSGRSGLMPDPPEFSIARDMGMKILPGTDPLPFRSERNRVGSFGFFVDGMVEKAQIWKFLLDYLTQSGGEIHPFGTLESPLRFVRNQVAMQYVTRVANRRRMN